MKRGAGWVALPTIVAAVGLALPAGAGVVARAGATVVRGATALDWCPGTASLCADPKAVETLPRGTGVTQICSTSGRGGAWFAVRAADGKTGWVPASRLRRAESVRSCARSHAVTAELWVTRPDVWNQVHPTAAMMAELKRAYGTAYDFGDDNDWSGDSAALGALAYLANGGKYQLPLTNPDDTYASYKSQGKVHTTGAPPAGALVFWKYVNTYGYSYGLLGLSLGNGKALTAVGDDTDQHPVTVKSTSNAEGWVLPY